MRLSLPNAAALTLPGSPIQWRWVHISAAHEWADHVTGQLVIETDFLDRLEALRVKFGQPLPINSGYRTPSHNRLVSDTGDNGPHTTGRAADIRIAGADALRLIALALELGFTGVGVQQKGDVAGRYLHLDDLAAPTYPRPMIWSYP